MSMQEVSEEQMVQEVYEFAAEQMLNGASVQQVRSSLMQNGLDPEDAAIVVSNVSDMRAEAIRKAGKKEMLHGGLWCIGGTVVTLVTYAAASGGGSYIIAWGAMIFGAFQFFRGLRQWVRH